MKQLKQFCVRLEIETYNKLQKYLKEKNKNYKPQYNIKLTMNTIINDLLKKMLDDNNKD